MNRLLKALAACAALLALGAVPAQATTGQSRTGGDQYDRNPSLVQDGGDTYMFFARSQQPCDRLDGCDADNSDYDLYYKLSTDGGKSFGPATFVAANPDGAGPFRGRTVAATRSDDGVVHVFWSNGANSINGDVYYFRQSGAGFTAHGALPTVMNVFNAEAVARGNDVFLYTQENGNIFARQYDSAALPAGPVAGPNLAATGKSIPKAIVDNEGVFRMTMVDDSGFPTVDVYTDSSADGLNWPAAEQLVVHEEGASNWDPTLTQKPNGEYYLHFAPDRGDGRQQIALTTSRDFSDWRNPHDLTPAQQGGTAYWDYWPEGFLRGNQVVLFYTSERGFVDNSSKPHVKQDEGTGHIWSDPGFGGLK